MLITRMRYPRALLLVCSGLFFFFSAVALPGLEYRNGGLGYALYLPEGWSMLHEGANGESAFSDRSGKAVVQIFTFASGRYASTGELADDIISRMGGAGDAQPFLFSGRQAVLIESSFRAGPRSVRGWFLFVKGRQSEPDFALLAYTPAEEFEKNRDALLSSVDSFSPDYEGLFLPGPVSQYARPFPSRGTRPFTLTMGEETFIVESDEAEFDACEQLIEREARLLAGYPEGSNEAWRRYYRIIYRDGFHRLSEVAAGVSRHLASRGIEDARIPEFLLSWIQGFTYTRTGTFSDLSSPLRTACTLSGDCDSRALLYVILLHHYSIDAVLFVSSRYSHSIAGVSVRGEGARMEVNGVSYLVAELTERVRIGLIARSMADPEGWIPVVFPVPGGM